VRGPAKNEMLVLQTYETIIQLRAPFDPIGLHFD